MSAAILRTTNGRRHWIGEQLGAERWLTLCGRSVRRPELLPAEAGVTCPVCVERRAGAR